MQISYYTSIDGLTGYGVQGFNYANELAKRKGVDLVLFHDGNVSKEASPELMEVLRKPMKWEGDVGLMNGQPPTWMRMVGERYKKHIGYMVFEGDKTPAGWINVINDKRIDLVFVPSKATRNVLIKDGADENKIKVVPHGINPEVFTPETEPSKVEGCNENFKFLYVGGWAFGEYDRKGMDILLKAYNEEFKEGEDVALVLKINKIYNRKFNVVENIKRLIGDTKLSIYVIENELGPYDLARLYKACNCYVLPSRGEAFGMTIAEASACGLPVIVTRNSEAGYMDFTDNIGAYYCEPLGKIPIHPCNGFIYEGSQWVEPDKESLKKMMRFVFTNQELAEKVGLAGSEIIREDWTWQKATDKMIKYMEE